MHSTVKRIGRIAAGLIILLLVLLLVEVGTFVYNIKFRLRAIDSSVSPDGCYELAFDEVGCADGLFGKSHARLVLKSGKKTVTEAKFDIANDGATLQESNWRVEWQADCVTVTIRGAEQKDAVKTLSFDGRTE
mgnify:FL=1